MYKKDVLSFEDAQRAVEAMLQAAAKDPRPVAASVVDERGDLVYFVKTDGARLLNVQLAMKKAYTAAIMRGDTGAFAERIKSQGRSLSDFGDPNLTPVQGGVFITKPETTLALGGIGVSGYRADEDEALAKVGLAAMKL